MATLRNSTNPQQHPPEVYILVRPPPSKGNHPLNVQIQMVTGLSSSSTSGAPATRTSSRMSGEYSRSSTSESGFSTPASFDAVASASVGGTGGAGMTRSNSVRSGRSNRSGSSSAGSQVGGTRRVTPLYNLAFHSVLQSTTVTDAGTDAKVAKFLKKGVEVHNLAIIDPVELSPSSSPTLHSSLSRSSQYSSSEPAPTPAPAPPPPPPPAQDTFLSKFKRLSFKTNNLLPPNLYLGNSKLLSKSDSNHSIASTSGGQPGHNVVPLFRTPSKEGSDLGQGQSGKSSESVHSTNPTAAGASTGAAGQYTKNGHGYTWQVRKWLRADLEKSGQVSTEEVRFEWRKAAKKRSPSNAATRGGGLRPGSMIGAGGGGAASDSHLPIPPKSPTTLSPDTKRRSLDQSRPPRRPSPVSLNSRGLSSDRIPMPIPMANGEELTEDPNNLDGKRKPKSINFAPTPTGTGAKTPDSERSRSPIPTGGSYEGGDEAGGDDRSELDIDSGEESDPEDSERPWTCHVVYGPPNATKRLLLATLTPAPHHPKLVAHLAVPFSLSPIPLGRYDAARGVSNEGLSVEEMKDVVCTTVLWLVVRESLGGLGKRRKGDAGWRSIRPM